MKRLIIFALALLWTTALFSAPYPYEWLSLGVSESPSTLQRVCWRTTSQMPIGSAQITESSGSPELSATATTVKANSTTFNDNNTERIYHLATLQGLKPATKYLYRIGDGDRKWSEWFEFRTAAATNSPFSFLYIADVQEGVATHYPRVIRRAVATDPNASFILFTGDLTQNATDEQFSEFFDANGWIAATKPIAPIPDNHEYYADAQGKRQALTTAWGHMFSFPTGTPKPLAKMGNYTFDYQGCRFIMLNSKEYTDGTKPYRHAVTLYVDSLLNNNPCRWTVVAHHQPIYSVADGRKSVDMALGLKPLYEKYGTDLIVSGHDHLYSRITTKSNGKQSSPVYISSNAGSQMYAPAYHLNTDRIGSDIQLFQVIDVTPNKLSFKAYDATGELYDAFAIEATPSAKIYVDQTPSTPQRTVLPQSRRRKYSNEQWQALDRKRVEYEQKKRLK